MNKPPVEPEQRTLDELARQRSQGPLRELFDFLRANRAWWLAPIVVVLLLISVLVILGASGAAPLIYTLF